VALGNALLLEQQACFLAKVAYHHTFVAWLIEREVVAVFCGNLLNFHALGQMILQLIFGKQAQVAQAIAKRLMADTKQLLQFYRYYPTTKENRNPSTLAISINVLSCEAPQSLAAPVLPSSFAKK